MSVMRERIISQMASTNVFKPILRRYIDSRWNKFFSTREFATFAFGLGCNVIEKPLECRRCLSLLSNKTQFSPDAVLTVKNRESCIRKLKLHPAMKVNEKARMAAVLVPLCVCRGELGLLYTLRSLKLNSNKGQVSFPGGMKDDTDACLEDTALRETWEELRIPTNEVDVWSSTNPIGRKNLTVMPVLGYIGKIEPETLQINPQEVDEAFVISLEKLCDPAHFRYTQFRNGFLLPAYTGGKHRVWGLTAAITHMMMRALLPQVYKNELTPLQMLGSKKHTDTLENQH